MYETRNVRFNEKLVYGDRYNKNIISYWENNIEEINKDLLILLFFYYLIIKTCFITFKEESKNLETTSIPEGELK